MHEHLIAQGFLDFVREAGDGYVFYDPARRRGKGDANRHAKKPGERLAAWVREDLGIDDPVLMPNHSWRHTFKTIAVGQEILASVSDAITGHANPRNEVGRRYEAPTLKAKAAAMARFPRFDLD
jgi:integrase